MIHFGVTGFYCTAYIKQWFAMLKCVKSCENEYTQSYKFRSIVKNQSSIKRLSSLSSFVFAFTQSDVKDIKRINLLFTEQHHECLNN